jgi:hypothetical protein
MSQTEPTTSEKNLVKVRFDLPPESATPSETLWAEALGNQLYRLDNTPWFAKGCALDDVVRCEENEDDLPRFVEVVRPSGNWTVRVFVPDGAERASTKEEIFAFLKQSGCVYEGYGVNKGLIAVTVPRAVDVETVLTYLRNLEAKNRAHWESGNF